MSNNEFPFEVKGKDDVTTKWFDSSNSFRVSLLNAEDLDAERIKRKCYVKIKSTWADSPVDVSKVSQDEIDQCFRDLLGGKVLPNSMEGIDFEFLIEGITHIEVTHLLRHRMAKAIHASCTADRFMHDDSAFIPSSVVHAGLSDKYKELTEQCKELYAEMLNSGVSLLDARYILPRNLRQFYYMTFSLRELIPFIHQRKCTQVQPESDNIIAHQMLHRAASVFPELYDFISMDCNESCFYVKSPDKDNSRLYAPDANHREALKRSGRLDTFRTFYDKTRKQMGAWFNPQDDE